MRNVFEANDEALARYLKASTERYDRLREVSIITAKEPSFERFERTFPIVEDVWGSEQYGEIPRIIEFIRGVNEIPENARMEVSLDKPTDIFYVKFTWWKINYHVI